MLIVSTDNDCTNRAHGGICCILFCAGLGFSQDAAALGAPDSPGEVAMGEVKSPTIGDGADAEKTNASKTKSDTDSQQDRQKLKAAMYVVGGIAFVGVVTILGVVLWGIRVRRCARAPSKPSEPFDPLWYLRKSAKPESKPNIEGQSGTNSTSDPNDSQEDPADSS